jgi:hypothetical protein
MSIAVYSAQQTQQLFDLFSAMTDYYAGDPARINHFVKVHAYARQIGLAEQLDADTLFLLEAAALTHDIGIREAECLYGQCGGKLQERLGPPEAQKMLDSLGFAPDVTERVCFLIAHHHTLDGVDALDWRILLEADFLVINIYCDIIYQCSIRTIRLHQRAYESCKFLSITCFKCSKPLDDSLPASLQIK